MIMAMEISLLPLVAPLVILLGGLVSPLVSKKEKLLFTINFVCFAVALVANTWMLLKLGGGALFYPNEYGVLVNSASAFVVEITLVLGLLGAIYSLRYFEDRNILGPFYLLYSLFLTSLILMAVSFNILMIYVAFEASTISGGILILFTKRRSATKAAVRFFIMSVIGALTILVGILYQNSLTGTFLLTKGAFAAIGAADAVVLASIYAIGFGIKVGVFPFGLLWLPSAHSEAPTAVSAILSGVMVQIAAFAVSRVIGIISPISDLLAYMLIGLGGLSVITGAALAAVEATAGSKWSRFHVGSANIRGIKRIWAFSTSSEVGVFYLLLGLGLLVPSLLPVFMMGILLHFLNHGLSKALLFFDSGVVIETSHVADLSVLRGLGSSIGVNALTYLVGGLSLSLIPFTLGYTTFREFTSGNVSMGITALILTAAAFILFTTLYSFRCIMSGKPKMKVVSAGEHEKASALLRIPGVVLALCILTLGIIVTLGANGIAFQGYYLNIEEWFQVAAETIVAPFAGGLV
jgi:formate hydrogenlyase subunit 3/multisubunit Na+/H+ antiporter MnhD subunit